MKLILFLILVIFSVESHSFLIPNPIVELDVQIQHDTTGKRDSFIKYANEYYAAYLNEFKKINNVDSNPFMPGLQGELVNYFKRLSEAEINSMTNDQVRVFLREQLADQLYIPYSEEASKGMLKDSLVNLKNTATRIDQLEMKMFKINEASKKGSKDGNNFHGVPLDTLYFIAVFLMSIVIFVLLGNNKKIKK